MSNEDGTVWIVYNGEIYNYRALNKELAARGHKIKSQCDTETIIHLYEEHGSRCVDYLRGMFSFAIWDARNKYLFAAVDRLRIKPFYYLQTQNAFVFSSELKAVLASGYHGGELNDEAVYHYLSLEAVPVPLTIYRNIRTLPGGHSLTVRDGEVTVSRYWDVNFDVDEGQTEAECTKRVRDLLFESVELRLMSDVPLGAFLSGGIDSSVIVGLMNEMRQGVIKTFSIGYDVGKQEYDETHFAELVSRTYRTDHTVQVIGAKDILDELKNFILYLDQPSTDAINGYFVSKLAARDVTVTLCGHGGDELFAGYDTFDLILKFIEREKQWNKVPSPIRQFLASLFSSMPAGMKSSAALRRFARFLHMYGSFTRKYGMIRKDLSEQEKRGLFSERSASTFAGIETDRIYERVAGAIADGVHPINAISYMELKTYLGDLLLRDMDVMSMAFSMETRIPLVDHRLVEYVATIPPELKMRNGMKKHILKSAMADLLPDEILNRRKYGFAFPFPIWLRGQLRPLVDFVLSRDHVEARGRFNFDRVERLKHAFFSGSDLNYRRIWGLVVLEMWTRLVQENDHRFFEQLYSHTAGHLERGISIRAGVP